MKKITFFISFAITRFFKRLQLRLKEIKAKRIIKDIDNKIFDLESDLLILSVKDVWTSQDIREETFIKITLPKLYKSLKSVNEAKMYYETQRYILSY